MKTFFLSFIYCFIMSGIYAQQSSSISVSDDNPSYWQYKGKKVLLLGGSVEDNLFQLTDSKEHLDLLVSVGGNYVRNTMSSRDPGNVWPFGKDENGLYDLHTWNDEYWKRFEDFLKLCSERDIIVQIEIWATFDFYRENWLVNPFNPKNNINYDTLKSKLSTVINTHPTLTQNNFFRSVPSQLCIPVLLTFQQKFMDKLLSVSLKFNNVLYCLDNETSVNSDWATYWASYLHKQARLEGKKINVTEMWDPWDLSHPLHQVSMDNPELFDFIEISQNNHNTGDLHWEKGLKVIETMKKLDCTRPLTNVKVYGNDGGKHQTTQEGIESFIRNVFFGASSARFHRPTSGQGLNKNAQMVIKSIRELSQKTNWFEAAPNNNLLLAREADEAYCRAIPGQQYMIYFPKGGQVELLTGENKGLYKIQWLRVMSAEWLSEEVKPVSDKLSLTCPSDENWIVVIVRK